MVQWYRATLALATGAALLVGGPDAVSAKEAAKNDSKELNQVVKKQQEQLDAQAREIAELKQKLNLLLGQTQQNTTALSAKADKKEVENLKTDTMVVSKNSKVDVSLYGQINRAALFADNGDSSRTYFVDNNFSSTRMGIDAVAKATDTLNVGGKLEYEIISNNSSEVNQDQEDTTASLKIRHADAFFESKTLGKLSLGQGSTATDGTAERDLSGTTVVAYSAVNYQAGGQKWFDGATNSLGTSQVKSVIDNMDGLSRRDRVRYDSPSLEGFQLSGSAIEAGGFDAALAYNRKFGGTAMAAAVGYATPGDLAKWESQYDGSFSILLENGLNMTLAGGVQEFDVANRNDPNFWYGKLGYKANLFSPGISAFSIDYGMWNDFELNDDEAESIGLAFVQDVTDWGTEFYIAYRLYMLDREGADADDINTVMSGARVKF